MTSMIKGTFEWYEKVNGNDRRVDLLDSKICSIVDFGVNKSLKSTLESQKDIEAALLQNIITAPQDHVRAHCYFSLQKWYLSTPCPFV